MKKSQFPALILSIGLLTILLFAFKSPQTPTMNDFPIGDFEKEWKTIDSLEQRGLPQSALKEVEKLYARAKRENNPSQIIKTIIYRGKYESQLEEDGFVNALNKVEAEIKSAQSPTKEILHSILGEMYSNYADNNAYQFQNRTETLEFDNQDIRTWSLEQILKSADDHYRKSVAITTRNIAIENLDDITNGQQANDANIRPTVYDFLTHRAIRFFVNDRSYLDQPANKFYLDDESSFAEASQFAKTPLKVEASDSRKFTALQFFHELIKFHLQSKNVSALIDADRHRLEFIHQNSILDIKGDLYEKALRDLWKKHESNPTSAEVAHQLAQYFFGKSNRFTPNPHWQKSDETQEETNGKWDFKTAFEICEQAIKKHPNTIGADMCNSLKANIQRKQLNIQVEKVYLPNMPLLGYMEYRNFTDCHFKLLKLSEKNLKEIEKLNRSEKISFLNNLPFQNKWNKTLPDDGDFRQHTIEFPIQGLDHGQYILMTADNAEFSDKSGGVFTNQFQVSNLAYVQTTGEEVGKIQFVTIHRKTGQPMGGVTADFYENDYRRRNETQKKVASFSSNKEGLIKPNFGKNGSFSVKFSKGEETLYSKNYYGNYPNNRRNESRQQAHFFLDRAIYRPGQTIYFKALAVEYDADRMPKILKNHPIIVTLKDVNYQDVSRLELTTNEYGTVNGTFIAPKGGLLGNMTLISMNQSRHNFRVEEYKRPKFSVDFDKVEDSYKLGDEVTIKGNAKAYAGNNIDGAKVTYRVVRTAHFPYWNWWRWGWYNPWSNSSTEIINGTTKTDENGKFEIKFETIPDRSISKETKPQFTYQVYADVVDITGETRSGNTYVNAGYVALDLRLGAKDKVNLNEENEISLTANNLNGATQKAEVEIQIFKLNVPNTIFNKRYWPKPDRQLLSESEFKKDYPLIAYANEDEVMGWKSGSTVFTKKVNVEGETKVKLNTDKLSTGAYKIVVTSQDKYGVPIELNANFTAYKEGEKRPPVPMILYTIADTGKKEPGQKSSIHYSTSTDELCLYGRMSNRTTKLREGWINVKTDRKITHEITEQDRGGLGFQTFAVKNNRYYQERQQIQVPWSNKDLKIEYATFRDKLRPGDEEEWVVKITGNKKEKVGAAFVAAMYDASLDAFAPNNWNFNPFPKYNNRFYWNSDNFSTANGQLMQQYWYHSPINLKSRSYRYLNWFNWNFGSGNWRYQRGAVYMDAAMETAEMASPSAAPGKRGKIAMRSLEEQENTTTGGTLTSEDLKKLPTRNVGSIAANTAGVSDENSKEDLTDVSVRTNLNETVFFFPNLMTNAEGDVIIKFTMNEALTKWKFLGFAHTPDLQTSITEKMVQTQKELMVVPNPPRFFREGDKIEFTAKVSNLTEKDMVGTAELQLFDAVTDEPIDIPLGNKNANLNFSAKAGQSDRLAWTIEIPNAGAQAIKHRIVAKAGSFSDGEEAIVPVLTNRMLVTETLPLPVRGGESKNFTLEKLKTNNSSTLTTQGLTLEYTSNPAWYAVQALPYLMEYPHQCTEQIFSRFYANSLATHVANSSPKVKAIFDRWKNYEPDALKSNLSKNQELKTALLEETPWVLDAQSEEQQKQNIALLFDLNRMSYEMEQVLQQLAQRQEGNGGWAWFPGGRPNWYITQYVVEGIGHLQRLGVRPMVKNKKYRGMMEKAIRFCDAEMVEQYEELERQVKAGRASWKDDHLNNMAIHYLYARTFFLTPQMSQVNKDNLWRDPSGVSMSKKAEIAFAYYHGQAEKYWIKKGIYEQGLIALALDRVQTSDQPADIVKSLKERSLNNEELGMYWKYNRGYYWHQMPIETHALMIEVFEEIAKDEKSVDDLKVWLLKNKQTNNWKTTKATASAVYALMMSGDSWITDSKPVKVSFPSSSNSQFEKDIDNAQSGAEAGTGYFKVRWDGKDVSPALASVKVENPNEVISWGSLYWQYFEQLDKITTFEKTPLTLKKQLFKVELSDTGEKIKPVSKSDVKVGDKLKVRIELRVDRDMEYVHMKDMRASGFEPMNVLSSYKWQGGLGYYESTKDASTNFFFDYLPKGTYVFEYPLRVVHNGDFSNGITTIQCMYAPEFTSHSEGERFEIKE